MDTVLIVLTIASGAAAAAFAFSAWRAKSDEQRRSTARVAALSAAIDASEPAATTSAHHPVAVTSMFATAPGASVEGRPLVKMGICAGLATTFIVVIAMANRDHAPAAAPSPVKDTALELISMHHTREGRSLTVTGLVRNPLGGTPRSHVSAVVFAFDRAGGFVASGRAALDFTTLTPGEESPFVVKIPDVAGVARYRVSFRNDEGIVRHLDRRADQLQAAIR